VAAPEEAIGKTDLDFQEPDLAQSFYEEEQRLVLTGESLINRIEFNPGKDGQPRWFSATKIPIKDTNGRVSGIVGVSRDITLLRQAEEALRQSEEKYRSLVERLPAITYISAFDEAKTRLYVSPQNERYLGFSPDEWLANPDLWRNQLHPRTATGCWLKPPVSMKVANRLSRNIVH
jgi:PAS domain-containing protein